MEKENKKVNETAEAEQPVEKKENKIKSGLKKVWNHPVTKKVVKGVGIAVGVVVAGLIGAEVKEHLNGSEDTEYPDGLYRLDDGALEYLGDGSSTESSEPDVSELQDVPPIE